MIPFCPYSLLIFLLWKWRVTSFYSHTEYVSILNTNYNHLTLCFLLDIVLEILCLDYLINFIILSLFQLDFSHQTGWSALVVNFLRYVNYHPMIVDHASAMINVQPWGLISSFRFSFRLPVHLWKWIKYLINTFLIYNLTYCSLNEEVECGGLNGIKYKMLTVSFLLSEITLSPEGMCLCKFEIGHIQHWNKYLTQFILLDMPTNIFIGFNVSCKTMLVRLN